MTETDGAPRENADAELRELVSRLLDGALDEEQRHRLEQRLREEPEARAYCVRNLRFDALIQEALISEPLELEETRRVLFDPTRPASTWIFQRLQTIRRAGGSGDRSSRRRWILPLAILLLAGGAGFAWWYWQSDPWQLRNADFEAMDLTRSPGGVGTSILDWQDYFRSNNATLCEIARASNGRIFAKSGRNVARLDGSGFLTQRLLSRDLRPVKARPGLTVELAGWAYCEGKPPFELRGSLRFVASSYPEMIQYEAAFTSVELEPGGWHPFKIRLTLPDDLDLPPSDASLDLTSATAFKRHGRTIMAEGSPLPSADLTGKELTLSIDQDSPDVSIYLDDLSIEVSGSSD